jgi:hypothetical protein
MFDRSLTSGDPVSSRHYVPEWRRAELQQQSEEVPPAAKEIVTATRADFERDRDRLLEYVRYLDALIGGCADNMVGLDAAALRQEREKLQENANRITAQLRREPHSWLYFGLLQEAKNAGVDLRYTSPPKGKPHGAGVDYLIAAAARHGRRIGSYRACSLIKQFNALLWARAEFIGAGNMSVCADVIESPSLWSRMWDEYLDWLRVNRRPNLNLI